MADYSPLAVFRAAQSLDDYSYGLLTRIMLGGDTVPGLADALGISREQVVSTLVLAASQIARDLAAPNPSGGLFRGGDRALLKTAIDADPKLAPLRGQPLVDALNAPAGTVPAPFDEAAILGVLGPTSRAMVINWPGLAILMARIQARDRPGVTRWAQLLRDAGKISEAERLAIIGVLAATVAGGPLVGELIPGWGQVTTMDDIQAIGRGA